MQRRFYFFDITNTKIVIGSLKLPILNLNNFFCNNL